MAPIQPIAAAIVTADQPCATMYGIRCRVTAVVAKLATAKATASAQKIGVWRAALKVTPGPCAACVRAGSKCGG